MNPKNPRIGIPADPEKAGSYVYMVGTDSHGDYIRCGTCLKKSYNENDIREGYCGFCHKFHQEHFDQALAKIEQIDKSKLPYPWCRQPAVCVNKGYCPRDPNCGD